MGFSNFMASTAGRAVRVIAGAALVVAGGTLGRSGWAITILGLVPLAAAALDLCLFKHPLQASAHWQGRPSGLTSPPKGATGQDTESRRRSLIREAAA